MNLCCLYHNVGADLKSNGCTNKKLNARLFAVIFLSLVFSARPRRVWLRSLMVRSQTLRGLAEKTKERKK